MSDTQDTEDRQDVQLRALLASIDPAADDAAGGRSTAAVGLLDRVLAESPEAWDDPPAEHASGVAASDRGRYWRRHWQGTLLVAASVATLALAGATVVGPLGLGSASDSAAQSETSAGAAREPAAAPGTDGADAGAAAGASGTGDAYSPELRDGLSAGPPDADASQTAPDAAKGADQTLVRSGSVLVGTDDQKAGRDTFVATVQGMGGRILSEAVVTEGGQTAVQPAYDTEMMTGRSYPYPWWPTGPGIWLTVQVPAEHYDAAMDAARATGDIVSMQQSSYDVGTQVADTDGRITALEESLTQLRSLMDETSSVSEVIKLEAAISDRQSELDGLKAQQRELANQTQMSQISLTLMSPDDATATVDPEPSQTWWESFVAGLSDAWAWLGRALMIISPLLVALGIIVVVRRRRGRTPGGPGPGAGGSAPATGTEPAAG